MNVIKIARDAGFHVGEVFMSAATEDDLKRLVDALRDALAEQPSEQEPVAHDEDLLERLYWEFDRQRKKTGEERLAFKGKMRFYASDFRRVSMGKAAFSQSVTDDMMNLADRLGVEYDDVDPKAWKHLSVYAPKPAKREPLTDEEIYECERLAAIRYQRHKHSIRGQQITPADDPQWHFARAVIAAYEAKNGITGETK